MRSSRGKSRRPLPENMVDKKQTREVLLMLLPYLLEFKGRMFAAFTLLVLAKVAVVTMPWVLKVVVDGLDRAQHQIIVVPLLFIVFYGLLRFGSVFFSEARDAVFSRITERAMRRIVLRVFEHLHALDLEFHLSRQTGGISRDVERGGNGFGFLMRMLVFNIVPTLIEMSLVAAILLFNFGAWYALITILSVGVYIYFTVTITEWRNRFVREVNQLDSKTNTRAVDSLLNYETVKYFNNEAYEALQYDQNLAGWESARLKNRMTLMALNSGQALIIATGMMLMMWLAAEDVASGVMTIGSLVMINAYVLQLFMPLNFLGMVYREVRRALTDIENMFSLLKREPTIKDKPGAGELQVSQGKIEFRNVCFSYQPERPIIQNLSFTVEPGQKLAIVGASGAGKSTLARLLFRFYDPDSGDILIDDQPICSVTQLSVRKVIGVVPQDTVLFNDTIRHNVIYGRPDAEPEEINKVIEMARLKRFIEGLPEGDQTEVGERGLKVSGGEKQRISIARVMLKNPPILLFDEATSALDSESEQAIVGALNELAEDHTSLVIAHRLSTVVDADHIIVLQDGKIAEQGNHQQLLAQDGSYARMWNLQQSDD
ncbi:ABC transporter ATP-binding protein/permease [Motiliproteus sp. MSK22-1]|uniref:ABCB family ABC transporter ATP-binding protein/permease n=1 Tax=Motiliproteus sp. MSK22-1 TaxID=1897630 RepID=UPI001E3C219E|nr:ABC transporter ATP-binding protein/permease [Motiliproteus sp. MSK22-1]